MSQIKFLTILALTANFGLCQLNGQEAISYSNPIPPSKRIASHLLIQDPIALESDSSYKNLPKLNEPPRPDSEVNQDSSPSDVVADQEPDRQGGLNAKPQRPPFGDWPRKGIRGISLDIRETSLNAPRDQSAQLLNSATTQWTQFVAAPKVFAWAAPDIRYQPLYFEDVALERYGQTVCNPYHQSVLSGIHFFKSYVFLRHHMRHNSPGSCDHPLGFCRPGNAVPYTIERQFLGRPF